VDAVSPHGERLDRTDEAIDKLLALMRPHHGSVEAERDVWSVHVSVQAANAPTAVRQAVKLVTNLGRAAGMPRWPAAHVEAMREDLRVGDLARPALPELVGPSEAAAMLGVSRQRVHQLATEHRRFPPPLLRLASGPLWLADAVRAFAATWERKPGRPRGTRRDGATGQATRTRSGQDTRSTNAPFPLAGRRANGAKAPHRHSDTGRSTGSSKARERVGAAHRRSAPRPASPAKAGATAQPQARKQSSRRRWLVVESGRDLPGGVMVASYASEPAAGRAATKRRMQSGAVDTQWHVYRDDDPALDAVSTVEELLRRRRTSFGDRGPVGGQ